MSSFYEPSSLQRHDSHGHSSALWNGSTNNLSSSELYDQTRALFEQIDVNGDGRVSQAEFVSGLLKIPSIDCTEVEARRMFEKLDHNSAGMIYASQFVESALKLRWLRSFVRIFSACQEYSFVVNPEYDYTKTTNDNYKESKKVFVGSFSDIRETRDYSWHVNYTVERQVWQDIAIRSCLGKTEPQTRPWVVFTCGPMGAGKGHVFSWLSSQGLFPLEYIVHVDPDFFKRIMPEWKNYVGINREFAGTACHQESAFLTEIAQEVAMRDRQHVWVDGSLSDGAWYLQVFDDIRKRFPHYRIAIFYVSASEETIRHRIQKRCDESGRSVPESAIIRSLISPENTIRILASKADLVVRIFNEETIQLLSVEDHSGNWQRGLEKHFGAISRQNLVFPDWLGPLYLENTAMVGAPFVLLDSSISTDSNRSSTGPLHEGYLLVKSFDSANWTSCTVQFRNGVLQCFSDSDIVPSNSAVNPDRTPQFLCEITEFSTVVVHETAHFEKKRRRLNDDTSYSNNTEIDEQRKELEYAFSLHFHKNGLPAFVDFSTAIQAERDHWVSLIRLRISEVKQNALALSNVQDNKLVEWRVSRDQMMNSPNVRFLLALKPTFRLKSTALCNLREEKGLTNVPAEATHFRWFYPSFDLKNSNLGAQGVDLNDPDIIFLLSGGFVYYDSNANVLRAMALSFHATQYFVSFTESEFLHKDDCDRLHAGGRWMKTTVEKIRQAGALYFTFIHPSEQLSTRRFPPLGCFAYLFREPTAPSDPRDRFFPVTVIDNY